MQAHFIDLINDSKFKRRATKAVGKAADKVVDTVKDHPIASVAIGAGVGYLLMRIARR